VVDFPACRCGGDVSEPFLQLPGRFLVGDWTADRQTLTISRGNIVRALEPRAFAVLCYLAERPKQLIAVDELLDELWAGTVVTPNAATRIIALLRKSLDDEAKQPRYIQTVARSGYRLIASVSPEKAAPSRRGLLQYGAVAAGLVFTVAVAVWLGSPKESQSAASVAVLPFENYTGDPRLDYLADGVAEEVINSLAQIPNLQVTARSLSFRFSGDTEAREFARELGVAFLVEGSVRLSGDHLRITAQLIAAGSGFHLWSHTAEKNLAELFAAQDAISVGVADALAETLDLRTATPARRVGAVPDPQAYDLYLRGRYVWHRRGNEPLQPAIDAFSEAVRIDPKFARGWAALASAYLTYPGYSSAGFATWHLAEDAANTARALDPDIPEVYGVLGTFAQNRLQWAEAHAMFAEGVRLGANSATAHFWYSEHLAKTGRFQESSTHLKRAMLLDPLYTAPQVDAGFIYLMFRDLQSGAEQFSTLWQTGTHSPTNWTGYFISSVLLGDYMQTRRLVEDASFPADQKDVLFRYIDIEENGGDPAPLVAEIFARPELQPDHRLLTWIASRLGAYEQTIAWLHERLAHNQFVDTRPLWGPRTTLCESPQFIELADALGLIDYWETVAWGDICRPEADRIVCDASALTPADLNWKH
jgi:TolB-like protein/DNA-binding winged helix-turn-helix (wHTH) protein/Tfp pilus assembly protein PilF